MPETVHIGPFCVPRLWVGLWQLSSNAWGVTSTSRIRRGMAHHVALGYTAFDMVGLPFISGASRCLSNIINASFSVNKADHYGSAESIFGQFRGSHPLSKLILGATKWCVFQSVNPTRAVVEAAVRERVERMHTDHVDLLQLHWQDYQDKRYLIALRHLQDLQSEGLITAIGLCNFDTIRTDEICTQLGRGALVSNQVQFSVIDTRPLHGMSDVCRKHNIKLLTYGTLCGGFLSDRWLDQPEPDPYSGNLTPSQRKYLDVILKAWGDWPLFQELLSVLQAIGDRHGGLSIANIATRWVLDHPFVGAVIIGVRLGLSEHSLDNQKVYGFRLSDEDNAAIESVLERSNGRQMIATIGDCGNEYRRA